jgi:hypothetical protein
LKGAIEKKNQFNKRLKKNKDQIEKITFLKLGLNNEIEKKIKILQKKNQEQKLEIKKIRMLVAIPINQGEER